MVHDTWIRLPLTNEDQTISLRHRALLLSGTLLSALLWISPTVSQAQDVAGFVLIDADTDQEIGPLGNGDVLDLNTLPTANLAVRADTVPATVGSVRFGLNGKTNFRTENVPPYALFGDTNGNFKPWKGVPLLGTHNLNATAFSGTGATGTTGTAFTISFEIVQQSLENVAPELQPIGDQTVEAGDSISIPVTASDQNGDTLILTASNLPAFATLIDSGLGDGSGTLDINPAPSDEGAYSGVVITVTDDGGPPLQDSQTISIEVKDFTPSVVTVDSLATLDTTPELTGTIDDSAATLEVTVDGNLYPADNLGDGTWRLLDNTIAPLLTVGFYDVRVAATDLAGNKGTDATTNELQILGSEGAVSDFVLINADTNQEIGPLKNGDILNLNTLATANLAVRTDTQPATVGSVLFGLDGNASFRTENIAPYALFGDFKGNFNPWSGAVPLLGKHTLTATPFPDSEASGTPGLPLTIEFEVTDGTPQSSSLFSWETRTNAPLPLYEAQGLAVDNLLYVFGGFFSNADGPTTTVEARSYDPAANSWTQIADVPELLTHAGQAADGSTIYIAGGYVGDHPGGSTAHVWIYETLTNSWSSGPDLPADRAGGALVQLAGVLHYFSGGTRTAGINVIVDFGDHWVLDLGPTNSPLDDGNAWAAAAALPNPRNHMAGVAVDGRVYAIGGQHGTNELSGNQDDVHAYNPQTDEWTQVADLPQALGHITAATFIRNGRIVITAGRSNAGRTAEVIEYDPPTDTWVSLPSLPEIRQSVVSGIIGNQIIVTGGTTGTIQTTTWLGVLTNKWELRAAVPVPLGEVAGGILGDTMYMVGEGNNSILAYNLATNTWSPAGSLAQRQFVGHHHAAEVFAGELYLLGGLGSSSAGKVQIYNPGIDAWRLGASAPFVAGSSVSSLIGDLMYLAGGIVDKSTTDQASVYDPMADSWSPLAPMPVGVNHAAAATDGVRLFVFGGRTGGNTVGNGFDHLQIYDPESDTWESSTDPGSTLAPLPQARGGTGKAVFFGGEFYIMGGETLDGLGATPDGVYERVDVYSPVTNTWRTSTAMPTARHGIFPLLHAGRIYVAGGGVTSGNSQSTMLEIYNPNE